MKVAIKRVYQEPSDEDGTRVLVDRLWPRGLTKQKANVDLWLKDIAPSTELRKWFSHDPAKWAAFRERYAIELKSKTALLEQLKKLSKEGRVTLLYGAKDELHNEAVILRQWILAH
jgi:uncharacterized protein YeaO (DUF488 family)